MLFSQRQEIILSLFDHQKVVTLEELVQETGSSESTIRRDLDRLEKAKKLKRIHGGASRIEDKAEEPSLAEKTLRNVEEKQNIGQYAASLVQEHECIYLDAGTTTMQMIPHLNLENLIVVTNGIQLVEPLVEKGIPTYLVGGLIKPKTGAMIGSGAIKSLENYRFDKCFIGINGIHEDWGYTTPDPEESILKQKVLELSQEKYVLADPSKFGKSSFSKVALLEEAFIITVKSKNVQLASFEKKTLVKAVEK
ncbi:DeoR/GlpR family DNA-binding transcription regulator [Fictibacillus enclensis]|uniref:DeoR/GlpR family DNA-binding transcription regulator n=1 Tax=Fictibacillus enclensis TaxID=1017270 RepID=UPI0025A1AB2E|nr:DeoR/GlpR family DNA-binding transcription regulator [Fictibacillus enclensis]MDM5199117.1 DeoR/GlpR family DNA-binding transcription regulator [Fictibacillus enclensis]